MLTLLAIREVIGSGAADVLMFLVFSTEERRHDNAFGPEVFILDEGKLRLLQSKSEGLEASMLCLQILEFDDGDVLLADVVFNCIGSDRVIPSPEITIDG